MGVMDGKRGLVVGIANDHSYAYFIAQSLIAHGAECLYTHLPGDRMKRRCSKAITQLGIENPWLESMDCASDEELDRVFDKIKTDYGSIDFLVHSIAFAEREWLGFDMFQETPREAYKQAIDISAYTYLAMGRRAARIMNNGGSMIAMSYLGAVRAVPGYNVMGVAKAALESTTRYLAMDLGAKGIRVNSISGGPLRTMSALAVGGLSELLELVESRAPLKRSVTGDDVGKSAVYLLSDMASGVTGQILYVDCGYSAMGI
ncbi:MAG: enoyl-ACP reductase [Planctomycetota bacterium]|nr:enoyl-ACP reductase [Planctomycetota bacterium]